MSWNAYTDSVIQYFPAMTSCALVGQDGSLWAVSGPGAGVTAAEGPAISSQFSQQVAAIVGGQRYMCLRAFEDRKLCKSGPNAVAILKTNQAYVVVVGAGTPQDAVNAAEYLQKDLISKNY